MTEASFMLGFIAYVSLWALFLSICNRQVYLAAVVRSHPTPEIIDKRVHAIREIDATCATRRSAATNKEAAAAVRICRRERMNGYSIVSPGI